MATTPNFGAILDKSPTEVERPKPVPAGHYLAVVKGLPEYDKTTKKQTEYVKFTLQLMSPGEDVDAEELAAMGGIADKTMSATYYITETALYRLKDFLAALGHDVDDADTSLRQLCESSAGRSCMIFVKHRASEDGQAIYAEISSVSAAE